MKCRLQWTVLMIAMIVVIDGGDDGKALRAAPLVGWWQSGKNTGSWRQIRAMGEVEQKPQSQIAPEPSHHQVWSTRSHRCLRRNTSCWLLLVAF